MITFLEMASVDVTAYVPAATWMVVPLELMSADCNAENESTSKH